MIVPDFTMFAAAYISNPPHLAFSAFVKQEVRDNVYIRDNDNKLFCQLSLLREEIATSEPFKQSKHSFDVNLEQSDVEDVESFSFFDIFDFCRNLKVKQTALTYHYEPKAFVYNSKEDALQSALNFYNMGNLNNLYIQKISSFFEAESFLLVDDQTSQEAIEIHEGKRSQIIKMEYLPLSQEELEDAFTHKASSVHDAFATEDSSSLGKQHE
ncbi:hypothetical protein [Bartonella queenslandensis]|uniref:hypothetical protein n=1 Tax=Bartonella queenslandensis TaxID=481138 RepID=UPI0005857072|nr:hypothetical protein [Bartonella queenslandensis]